MANDPYQSFMISASVALLIAITTSAAIHAYNPTKDLLDGSVLCKKGLVAPCNSVPALKMSFQAGWPQSLAADAM